VQPIRILVLGFALIGTLYYIASMLALLSFSRRSRARQDSSSGRWKITVLKPICGLDRDGRENLSSFVYQDYDDFEVRLGFLDSDDPAIEAARLAAEGSGNAIVRHGSRIEGSNNKVRILDNLARDSQGDLVVIADSDVRVTPDFLSRISAPFSDPTVGVVTCLYRGIKADGIADALEGLYMTCDFAPGVACSAVLGEIDFSLGAATAIRSEALAAFGGFPSLVDYIADDFQLGKKAVGAGYKVVLSDYVVDIVLSAAGIKEVAARELRWSRTIRISQPLGHLGLIFTYGFPFAVLACLISPTSTLSWATLLISLIVRGCTAFVGAGKCLGDKEFPRRISLLPIRDLMSFGVWIASYFSRSVIWRGRRLRLLSDGKMVLDD